MTTPSQRTAIGGNGPPLPRSVSRNRQVVSVPRPVAQVKQSQTPGVSSEEATKTFYLKKYGPDLGQDYYTLALAQEAINEYNKTKDQGILVKFGAGNIRDIELLAGEARRSIQEKTAAQLRSTTRKTDIIEKEAEQRVFLERVSRINTAGGKVNITTGEASNLPRIPYASGVQPSQPIRKTSTLSSFLREQPNQARAILGPGVAPQEKIESSVFRSQNGLAQLMSQPQKFIKEREIVAINAKDPLTATIYTIGLEPFKQGAMLGKIASNPKETIAGITGLGREITTSGLTAPKRITENVKSGRIFSEKPPVGRKLATEQYTALTINPLAYATGIASQAIFFGGIGKEIGKANAPKSIKVIAESTREQPKGTQVGGASGYAKGDVIGIIESPRFGRIGEIIRSKAPKGGYVESLLTKKTPLTATESFVLGKTARGDALLELAGKKLGIKKPYLVETRGIGEKATGEVKPQSEALKIQFEEPLFVRTTGESVIGTTKREFGASGQQRTSNFTGSLIKESKYFPGGIAERQYILERQGRVGIAFKEGSPGKGAAPKTRIPSTTKTIADPLKGIRTGVLDYVQNARGTKVETGLYGGSEQVKSKTTGVLDIGEKTKIFIEETTTTIGKKGSKTRILEDYFGGKTQKELTKQLRELQIKEAPPMAPFPAKKTVISDNGINAITKTVSKTVSKIKPETSTTTIAGVSSGVMSFAPGIYEEIVSVPLAKQTQLASLLGVSVSRSFPVVSQPVQPTTTRLNVSPVIITRPATLPRTSVSVKPVQVKAQVPVLEPITKPILSPASIPKTEPVSKTIPITLPIQQPIQKPVIKAINKPIQSPATLPIIRTGFRPIRQTIIQQPKKEKITQFFPAFGVITRKGGKEFLLPGKYTKEDAFSFGAGYVDKTLRASFKVVQLPGFAQRRNLPHSPLKFTPGKKGFFVEPSARRLSTRTEISEIIGAKKARKRFKGF